MSEQTKDETKSGKTAATPGRSDFVRDSEKSASDLPDDELSKISGGIVKPHADAY
jgi:hypothetical protein